ncbi:MAG: hypothetical protein IT167_28640 [Bryobacterales bacterium]|nr:hypothetical protein [Bryobacterales bacterium]
MSHNLAVYEIVRLIDLHPSGQTGYCILIAPAESVLAAELREELEVQCGLSLAAINAGHLTVEQFLDQLAKTGEGVVLVTGLGSWTDSKFVSLDINRRRLDTGAFLVFWMDSDGAGRFLDHAPNIRSYVGARVFSIGPDTSAMSPQEVTDRLQQLRSHFHLSDEEVLAQAAQGNLPAGPEFAEWLFLLGRSELVR